jgi:polyisoprenoid-binding protein YceI
MGSWNIATIHSQVMGERLALKRGQPPGQVSSAKGSMDVNADDPLRSRFPAEIEATSVTTGHHAQEDFMRSEPRPDVEQYPPITFHSTTIEPLVLEPGRIAARHGVSTRERPPHRRSAARPAWLG